MRANRLIFFTLGSAVLAAATFGLTAHANAPSAIPDDLIDRAIVNQPTLNQEMRTAAAARVSRTNQMVLDCLQQAGFAALPAAPAVTPPAQVPFARTDEEHQLVAGYGVTNTAPSPGPGQSIDAALAFYGKGLPAPEQDRLVKTLGGADGCRAKAQAGVSGQLNAAGDAFDAVRSEMFATLAKDARVAKAAQAWTACMGTVPQQFADPPAVTRYLADRVRSLGGGAAALATVHAEEMTLAARDLGCRTSVVDPTYRPLLAQAEKAFLAAHSDLVDNLRAALLSH